MAKQSCLLCGAKAMQHKIKAMTYSYKGHDIQLNQPGHYCDACGESILEPEDLKATRKDLADFKARVDHLLTPDEIRSIRKRLKLNQKAAANLCGGGKNAFSRYESGEVLIPRAASNLLRVLGNHKELINELNLDVA